ncbi:hypothetical protein SUGI_0406230 [Cryptomeria japonica]|uniref:uncharacterized protein LOC131079499 n=1 Tax=Cryptomeria japonica TaxID=3369 RepID=UPI002408BDB1|nr:uncharacterized protein LOC131079499 [Cryptomeria japonica]GLJ21767.1 hypothetical protein SUGI_0406230 [Cryptomeria japonica]
MRDFPSCFGEHGVQVTESSTSSSNSRMTQNLVTCVYQAKLGDHSRLITVTWCKNLMGQGLSVNVDDESCPGMTCKVDMKPWLFSKKKGSRSFEVGTGRIDVFWDLSFAKYGSGPEPLEGYFLAVVSDSEMALLLGDMTKEAYKKTHASPPSGETILISKKEHVFGKKVYNTTAQFSDNGQPHDIMIECHTVGLREPRLSVHIDRKMVMQVKHLMWKFRGNQTILIDGLPVEVFWDVHNWLFNPSVGNAVFMFQTGLSTEKSWYKLSSSSILPLPTTQGLKEESRGLGFSLLLYAWKSE